MKIGKTRLDLHETFTKILYDLNKDYKQLNKVIERMGKRGYLMGDIQPILTLNTPLDVVQSIDLYTLVYEIYQETQDDRIEPSRWFTDLEISNIKRHKRIIDTDEIKFPIVLKDVIEISKGHWITGKPMTFIAKLWNANMISYNFDTQRDPKLIYHDDTIIKVPNTNQQAVNEITNKIKDDSYIPNIITLNILKNGDEFVRYDNQKKTLTITKGVLNILDGFHRSLGILNALMEGTRDRNFELRIFNIDASTAAAFVKQEDIRNKISEDHLQSIDKSELNNIVVQELNNRIESELKGRIATDRELIQNNTALTMFTTMTTGIKKLWKLNTRRDANNLADYLMEFFNELIGLYPDEFILNVGKTKRKSLINHSTMFMFYLTLAKRLQNDEDWKEKLEHIMEFVDFDKGNKSWSDIGITSLSSYWVKRHSSNIIKESENLLKEVI